MQRQDKKNKSEIILKQIEDNNFENTYCFETASSLIRLIAEDANPLAMLRLNKSHLLEPSSESSECFQRLLNDSTTPEHLVFQITVDRDMHAFVVEKESDGNVTGWRIYQSCRGTFDLHEWLNITPWPITKDYFETPKGCTPSSFANYIISLYRFFNDSYIKYGKGKTLDKNEINDFIRSTLSFCYHQNGSLPFFREFDDIGFIKLYNVNQNIFLAMDNDETNAKETMKYSHKYLQSNSIFPVTNLPKRIREEQASFRLEAHADHEKAKITQCKM